MLSNCIPTVRRPDDAKRESSAILETVTGDPLSPMPSRSSLDCFWMLTAIGAICSFCRFVCFMFVGLGSNKTKAKLDRCYSTAWVRSCSVRGNKKGQDLR